MRSARRRPRQKSSEKKSNLDYKGDTQNDNEVHDKDHDSKLKRTIDVKSYKGNKLFRNHSSWKGV